MQHTVTEQHLPSGAKGLLIHVPGASVTSIVVRFNSGFQFSDQARYEIPHIMEHMLATSSKKYPQQNGFIIEAQKNGAFINAHTSSDINSYVFECADFERARILDLLEEQLVRPLFDDVAFAAEVGNVREELSQKTTNYGSVASLLLGQRAFPGQALDLVTRINQLPNITLDDLAAHYKATHTAANARFFIAGDIEGDREAIADRLERIFSRLPRGKRLVVRPDIGLNIAEPLIQAEPIKQVYYCFDHYFDEVAIADQPAAGLLRLVLTAGMGSLIFGEARRRGLAYHMNSGMSLGIGNSEFGFSGFVTPDHADELFEVIERHWADLVGGKLEPAVLAAAQALGVGSTRRAYQTVGDIASWYTSSYDSRGIILDFDDYLDQLQQVTPQQVTAMAKRIEGSGRRGLSIVGDINDKQALKLAKRLYN